MSEEIKSEQNIYQRMQAVMRAVGYVQKEEKLVNNQYRFVSHDAVTAKIRPALIENGILTVARVVNHGQDGNRTEADVEVDFVNVDKPEDRITIPMFGYGIDPQDKGPGKAISYAVKYAYLKAFALETGDDPERDAIDHKPAEKKFPSSVQSALQGVEIDPETVAKMAKISSALTDLVVEEADGVDNEYKIWELIEPIEEQDDKLYLSSLLGSKVRARLKVIGAKKRAEAATA